jgi:hypothetical protein
MPKTFEIYSTYTAPVFLQRQARTVLASPPLFPVLHHLCNSGPKPFHESPPPSQSPEPLLLHTPALMIPLIHRIPSNAIRRTSSLHQLEPPGNVNMTMDGDRSSSAGR